MLFRAAEDWARARHCVELKVETQNINVPACRFYAQQRCTLKSVRFDAYPDLPNEIQLLWHKALLRGGAGTAPAIDRDMRLRWASTLLTVAAISSAQTARFGVNGVTTTPSTIVATIQPRTAAQGIVASNLLLFLVTDRWRARKCDER